MGSNALDNLAAHGIIDFDADSYVKGEPPKFVGSPTGYVGLPFDQPLNGPMMPMQNNEGARLKHQPDRDAFITHYEDKKSPLPWKKILAGGLGATVLVYTGFKVKNKLKPIKEFFTRNTDRVKSWFKSKPAVVPAAKPVATTTEVNAGSTIVTKAKQAGEAITEKSKGLFAKLKNAPKWLKISGGSLGGLVVLYGIYKLLSVHKHHAVSQQEQAQPE